MNRIIFILALTLSSLGLYAQKTLDVVLGIGLPDMVHIGGRVQLKPQAQLGLSFGRLQVGDDETTYAISADFYAHFGKQGRHAERKLWYYRGGFTRTSEDEQVNKDIYLFLNNRIGKDFYFSRRIGISFDLGIAIVADHSVKNKQETSGWLGGDLDLTPAVFPCADLSLFCRF